MAITSDNEYICNWCDKIKDNPHEEIERECEYYESLTNADRIRSMDDMELASFLHDYAYDSNEDGMDIIYAWLKSEVGCE
jgi:hypothetical protein